MRFIFRNIIFYFLSVSEHTLETLDFSLHSSQTTIILIEAASDLKPKQLVRSVKGRKKKAKLMSGIVKSLIQFCLLKVISMKRILDSF